jgi:hypothetical protein
MGVQLEVLTFIARAHASCTAMFLVMQLTSWKLYAMYKPLSPAPT